MRAAGTGRIGRLLCALGMAAGLWATPAAVQGQEWRIQVTPYVWATGLGGKLAAGPLSAEIDTSFSEVLRDLDGAFFVSGFARRDRLVLLGDLSWSSSSRAGVLPPPAPPLPAEGRLRQTSLTLAAGYRVVEGPAATVDLLAGLRHWRLDAQISAPVPPFAVTRRARFTDPIIATRINAQLAPDWSALFYLDFGGFGAGSRLSVQALATVNRALSEQLYLSAGYRHLQVDYRGAGMRVDARMSGPILGVTWRF